MQSLRSIKIRSLAAVIIFSGLIFSTFPKSGYTASNQSGDDFPTEPILRLETGMHTAPIFRIDVDRDQRFVVSGSNDKTVRIWDLKTGRLLRTLRVPLGDGFLGNVYSVAISPDGNSVAAGGWTGAKFGLNCDIYIFNRESGETEHVISGLPNVINHLTFSSDGKYLAATLGKLNGVRVYETQSYKQVAEDGKYSDISSWADFHASGRLVTTSYDGHIRLYDKNFSLIQKKQAPGGKRPFSASFSPDGRNIAVVYGDTTRVDVLSAENLELRFSANTSETNRNFYAVAWSKDGRYLYAGGLYSADRKFPIRRWSEGGRGSFIEFKLAENTVMDLKPLANGQLAVGAQDPLIAVLSADGQPIWQHRGNLADFRGQRGADGIRLSKSGDIVQFGYEIWGKRPARFSLKTWQLELNPPEDSRLSGQITEAPGLKITDWIDSFTPKLNGNPLALDKYERSRSLAIAPDHNRFLLGSEWYLRLFDHTGKKLWQVNAPAIAWAVNISEDGRLAVAGYSDGTIRWHRMSDGKELLALFPHNDGKRWIAWTPQGFYQASAGAEDLIGWHLNHGSQQAPDFYGASRFREQFYRPDVVAGVLDTLDVKQALALADKARGSKTVTKDIKTILPPTITILAPASGTKTEYKKLTLTYRAESKTGPITAIETRLDGRPIKPLLPEVILSDDKKGDRHHKMANVTIEVPPQDAVVTLIASNRHGKSDPATFYSNWAGKQDWYKPELYVLAVGVSRYSEAHLRLKYAAKDAGDFVKAIQKQQGGLYKKVTVRLLDDSSDRPATREKILDGLDWLQRKTKARDVAMVFLSGHGFNDERGKYNFLPLDYDPARRKRTTLHDYEVEDFLSTIAGKTVLFFDTCHSGNVVKGAKVEDQKADVDKFANELADADSGVIVFSSSTGKQFSVERDEWKNGAFTKALLEGIDSQVADYHKDWHVSIAELEVYLSERVAELTKDAQKPVTAKPKAVENFKIIWLKH